MKRLLSLAAALLTVAFAIRITAQPMEGRQIFRYDTFGDEQLWTDHLKLHTVVPSLAPVTALGVGLKVDVQALPPAVVAALKAGTVNVKDPAVTMQLLALNAVVGVIGKVNASGGLDSIGVTCALCHSTVDDSLMPGIGRRLDGWPNRHLNVGAIIALSPVLTDAQKTLLNSWGPGKHDPRMHAFDGAAFIPLHDGTFPVVLPPAYGLRQVPYETYTGDGAVSYWNAYVGIGQMGGHGDFSDPRIPLTIDQPPPDLVTPKLKALRDYQLSLKAPEPPPGSFDKEAARRGRDVFRGLGRCDTCHVQPAFTDVGKGPRKDEPFLHRPAETGMEPVYASRSVTGDYRTSPLAGVWQHPPYFHDGSAATLEAVVDHYNRVKSLGLTPAQKADLVEYLKSL